MIIGVGTDMIEIMRVGKACKKQAFLSRIYTDEECRQAGGNMSSLAGNFAVKEAVAKSFGTGFYGFGPKEIEVLRDKLGKPYIKLWGRARELAKELGVEIVHISITNTKEYATAMAVAEGFESSGEKGRYENEILGDRQTDETG